MFESVLIANRGEIAVRIIRACRELGVRTIAVYSEPDADAPHVRLADEAHLLGPAATAESYLAVDKILGIAARTGAEGIHPGYGFLAENAGFAQAVLDAGLVFIGPGPHAIAAMGDKLSAREVASNAGVPVVPGTPEPVVDVDTAVAFGTEHGYPVAVKAMFGGGGRGMKIVHDPTSMKEALAAAQREAVASFGRGECYLERYLERPRHIEVQILADLDGTTIQLADRDCSLQRRHQKLLEEAPAPDIAPHVRAAMAEAAVKVARAMDYTNAGTCEFLLDADGETFYFLEMNTRLQVEHPVTELVTGIDLAQAQLRIASGDGMGVSQDDVRVSGHSIEVRINAEDPGTGFIPTPGRITELQAPLGPWVRFDTGAESDYEVPPYYDSMIGKLVVWAEDRDGARRRMASALDELVLEGIATTVPFDRLALEHPQFVAANHSTVSVETEWDLSGIPPYQDGATPAMGATMNISKSGISDTVREVELTIGGRSTYVTVYGTYRPDDSVAAVKTPRRDRGGAGGAAGDGGPEMRAPMQGTIVSYAVEPGDTVEVGQLICVLEAMKMENLLRAHRAGTVTLEAAAGQAVEQGATLARIQD